MVAARLLVSLAIIGLAYSAPQSAEDTEDRVVGGRNAPLGAFKPMVSLQIHWSNGRKMQYCGGTLIHPQVVVTAAHCIMDAPANAQLVAVMGLTQSNCGDAAYAQVIPIARSIPHPEYSQQTLYNDIGLVQLARPAQMTAVVGVAELASEAEIASQSSGIIWGWGGQRNEHMNSPTFAMECVHLQVGVVNVLPKERCEDVMKNMGNAPPQPQPQPRPRLVVINGQWVQVQKETDEVVDEKPANSTVSTVVEPLDPEFEEEIKKIPNVGYPVVPTNLLRSTHNGNFSPMNLNPETQVCVKGPSTSACKGDSGGPFTMNGKLVGCTSHGHPTNCQDNPAVYTKMEKYKQWMAYVIQSLGY